MRVSGAQLDLQQSKKNFARNPLSPLTPEFLLRAARVYSATPPGPTEALFLNQIPFATPRKKGSPKDLPRLQKGSNRVPKWIRFGSIWGPLGIRFFDLRRSPRNS